MKIAEILKQKESKVFTIKTDVSVYNAIEILNKEHIGSLIVVNNNHELEGIITERDILYKCYKSKEDNKKLPVSDIMTKRDKLIIGTPDDNSSYAMNIMTKNRIRHLPIIDSEKVVGLLSIGDVIKVLLDDSEAEAKNLREYIKSPYGIPVV